MGGGRGHEPPSQRFQREGGKRKREKREKKAALIKPPLQGRFHKKEKKREGGKEGEVETRSL